MVQRAINIVANSQYHLAVAGGCEAVADAIGMSQWCSTIGTGYAPTRYREVVVTVCHDRERRSE